VAFKGTLKDFKVPDVLQIISLQKKTGILTFTSSDGFITLVFDKGSIAGVDAFPKKLEMRVGTVLEKQDLISKDMVYRALSIQKRTNQQIGEILLSMGVISNDSVKEALRTQATEIVLSLFKWKRGDYSFKSMYNIDTSIKSVIPPLSTHGIIMQGVQMLDEWPMIHELIPDENIVFEPLSVDDKTIEIVEEYEDEEIKDDKIYISKAETDLLKYINGENSVNDLFKLGILTTYKLYKSLFNLINKSLIKAKEEVSYAKINEEEIYKEFKLSSEKRIITLSSLLLISFILILIITFFNPLKPINKKNIIFKQDLINKYVSIENKTND